MPISLIPNLMPRNASPGLLLLALAALGSLVLLLRGPGQTPADLHED